MGELKDFVGNTSEISRVSLFVTAWGEAFQLSEYEEDKTTGVFMGVTYDFETQKWYNSYDITEFNSSLWTVDS